MVQSQASGEICTLNNYDWIGKEMKQYYCFQFQGAIENALKLCGEHLDAAVKNGRIGSPPYNEEHEKIISGTIEQCLLVMIRNVDNCEVIQDTFLMLFNKIAKQMNCEVLIPYHEPVITMLAMLPNKHYHGIALPIIHNYSWKYDTVIEEGKNEAEELLKKEEKTDLHSFIELFKEKIEEKCKEAFSNKIKHKFTDGMMENTVSDSIKTNEVSVRASSSSSTHDSNDLKPGQTNTSGSSSGSSIDKNICTTNTDETSNGSSSVAKEFSTKGVQNGRSNVSNSAREQTILDSLVDLTLLSDDEEEDRVVSKKRKFSSSAANSIAGSSKTPLIGGNGKRPRLCEGAYYVSPSDEEIENLRQAKRMLQGYGSDSDSDSEFPNSRPSKSRPAQVPRRKISRRHNFEERVTEFLGEGIETRLYKNGVGLQICFTFGDKKRFLYYFREDWLDGKRLKVEDTVFIKLHLGKNFTYIDKEQGNGAQLLLSKQKFDNNQDDKKVHPFFLGRYRPLCQEIIQEIIQKRSTS